MYLNTYFFSYYFKLYFLSLLKTTLNLILLFEGSTKFIIIIQLHIQYKIYCHNEKLLEKQSQRFTFLNTKIRLK